MLQSCSPVCSVPVAATSVCLPLPLGDVSFRTDLQFYHPGREYNVRVASRYFKGPELLVDLQVCLR